MGRRLLVEMYFVDGVNEEDIKMDIERAIDKAGYAVGDIFWEEDEHNNCGEEIEVDPEDLEEDK